MKSLIRLSNYLPAVLLVIVIAVACSKTSSNSNSTKPVDTTKTVMALIVAKPWKFDTSGFDTNNSGTINQGGDTTVVPPCQRDDIYTFNSDYTGSLNTGTRHCSVNESQTQAFAWSLSTDRKTLKASFNSVLQAGVTILKLDSLHWSVYRDSAMSGVTYRYIVQLKHPN